MAASIAKWVFAVEHPTNDKSFKFVTLPRKVTCTMNEEEAEGDDRTAGLLHYSIDVETKNYKLDDAQRDAMRRMIQLTLGELKTKLQFVLDDPGNAKAVAHISSSSSGRRELLPLEE